MKLLNLIICLCTVFLFAPENAHSLITAAPAFAPSAPPADSLADLAYTELPLGAVKPEGWLRDQLVIMRKGTTGHLDEVYGKIKDDNGWLGGQGDGWEETPYWLDGAVPLAYLLNDKDLKKKVLRYINWTLDNQRPSGYFGPITEEERKNGVEITPGNCAAGEDWWPKMIMLKVLKQYYTATGDERVIPFMSNYFNYQLQAIKGCPLGQWTEWAQSRGADNVMMAQWLHSLTGEAHLLELASVIESQAFQWSDWFAGRDWVIGAAARQNEENWMHRHSVNVAMALKSPALNYRRTHDGAYLSALKTGFTDLMTLHGLPMGIFSGDEDLHGNAPTQGVELCAITESMFSLEKIISITGDIHYMDALERMTFNALPAQTTDDYNMKQYFQVANQVQVSRGVFDFSLPFEREMNNVFGLRAGYTCCLSNMHQGWTKFTTHLWYGTPDGGLAALAYSPSTVTARVGQDSVEVEIHERTAYPFKEDIEFEITTGEAVAFPLALRIPSWCTEAVVTLNGEELRKEKGGQVITVDRTWESGDVLQLKLPMQVSTSNWGKNSRAIERGPLVYALKLQERWEKGHHEEEGDYYSVYPTSDWNYGLLEQVIKAPAENLEISEGTVAEDFVWNLGHAPVEITAPARKIPGWKAVGGVAHQPITTRVGIYKGAVSDTVEKVTLVPYGFTKVRVVAFPVVK